MDKYQKCKWSIPDEGETINCFVNGLADIQSKLKTECETCAQYKCRYIEFPIVVENIEIEDIQYRAPSKPQLVAVRPCQEEYGDKTYLGILLGDIPWMMNCGYNTAKHVVVARTIPNPGIYVPSLNKIIFGAESWWTRINSEEELKQITDDDINNTWYVQLLRHLSK